MLLLQSLPTGSGQPVVLRAPVQVGALPLRLDPAFHFQPLERGIERSKLDRECRGRSVSDSFGDAVPMERAALQGAQDQHVEQTVERLHVTRVYIKIIVIFQAEELLSCSESRREAPAT